jgi:hypothetical protein
MPDAITKALATISETDGETGSPNGSFEAILSAPTLDRDGDTLGQDGWKSPLPDKIHIDLDHEMSVAGTVGSAAPYFDSDGNLRIKGTYASTPRAQEVRTLVNEGHITTMSVAFMTDRQAKDGAPNRELLNGAFVAVPSNREAKVVASKAFDAIEAYHKAADDKPKPPYGDVTYADPGYLDREGKPAKDGNGVPRYPVNNAERARAAWSYINMPKNASQYSAEQLAKIKDKIKAACDKFGIKIDDSKAFHDALTVVDAFMNGDSTVYTRASIEPLGAPATQVKAGARNSASDSRLLQGAHDALVILGAQCMEAEPDADDGSDDGANKSAENVTVTVPPKLDAEAFKAQLEALTDTSGLKSGSPDSPADAPAEPPAEAAPPGPADAAGGAAADAAEEMAQKTAAEMLAGLFASEVTLATLEP